MHFKLTSIADCVVVEPEPTYDDRGFFARLFDVDEFRLHGLSPAVAQTSLSYSRVNRTVRGLHLQGHPAGETKVVRCTAGRIYDVAVDLRRDSPSFRQWVAVELSASNRLAVVIGPGIAHGFCTLTDDAEVHYQMSVRHDPSLGIGIRWDDPDLAIEWPPGAGQVVSVRDRALPDLRHFDLRRVDTGP